MFDCLMDGGRQFVQSTASLGAYDAHLTNDLDLCPESLLHDPTGPDAPPDDPYKGPVDPERGTEDPYPSPDVPDASPHGPFPSTEDPNRTTDLLDLNLDNPDDCTKELDSDPTGPYNTATAPRNAPAGLANEARLSLRSPNEPGDEAVLLLCGEETWLFISVAACALAHNLLPTMSVKRLTIPQTSLSGFRRSSLYSGMLNSVKSAREDITLSSRRVIVTIFSIMDRINALRAWRRCCRLL